MDAPKRVLAITKRVDLSTIADGWDGAYAIVRVRTGKQLLEAADLDKDKMTNEQMLTYEADVAKANLVVGKVAILNADNKPVLADMREEDLEVSEVLADRLYAAIMGVDLDPKDTAPAAPSTTTPSDGSSTTPTASPETH